MSRVSAKLVERIARVRLPVRSVRLRLTALYGGLFLVSGVGLLAITYLLVSRATAITAVAVGSAHGPPPAHTAVNHGHSVDLHQLLVQSGIALAIMSVVSALLGWVVAGRVLRTAAGDHRDDPPDLRGQPPRSPGACTGPTMSSRSSPTRSMGCWSGSRPRSTRSDGSSPTPRTNCARRWRRCARRSTSRSPSPAALPPQMHHPRRPAPHRVRPGRPAARELPRARPRPAVPPSPMNGRSRSATSPAAALARHADANLTSGAHRRPTGKPRWVGDRQRDAALADGRERDRKRDPPQPPGGWIHITSSIDAACASLVVENGGELLAQDNVERARSAIPAPGRGPDRLGERSRARALDRRRDRHAHGGTLDLHARSDGGLRVIDQLPLAAQRQPRRSRESAGRRGLAATRRRRRRRATRRGHGGRRRLRRPRSAQPSSI